ncbi:MAG: Flp family type IVb pilin [Abitibacteriaceae bacterium]|nr:Flp family type IVb pilin [Abditibacteriaceae bacterium]MBV9865348.1 Flp family type IVb pilin [Abditibacteriaceae bacterium]
MKLIRRWATEEGGVTMVEYAMLISLIALVTIAGLVILGNQLQSDFQTAADNIKNPPSTPRPNGGGPNIVAN